MAYTTINKSGDYFNTKLYTGTGSSNAITGVGFQPDWTWIKNRGTTDWHRLLDAVRGATEELYSNATTAETTQAQSLKSFDTDGFTLGTLAEVNTSSENYASWNWKANGQGSANTDGSISSTVSANTTAGFSIVSYTGTGSNATVGHGLGSAPKIVILKDRDNSTSWPVGGDAIGTTDNNYLLLNETNALDSATTGFKSFSTTTVGLGSDTWFNGSSRNYIAYCFAEKTGYSKFGSYVGNGNADGTFVYTGFKPSWVLTKASSRTGRWRVWDNKRSTFNVADKRLDPSSSDAVSTGSTEVIDILSNGFKIRTSEGQFNGSGETNIYMAFAEAPLVGTNNVPCTAR